MSDAHTIDTSSPSPPPIATRKKKCMHIQKRHGHFCHQKVDVFETSLGDDGHEQRCLTVQYFGVFGEHLMENNADQVGELLHVLLQHGELHVAQKHNYQFETLETKLGLVKTVQQQLAHIDCGDTMRSRTTDTT